MIKEKLIMSIGSIMNMKWIIILSLFLNSITICSNCSNCNSKHNRNTTPTAGSYVGSTVDNAVEKGKYGVAKLIILLKRLVQFFKNKASQVIQTTEKVGDWAEEKVQTAEAPKVEASPQPKEISETTKAKK